MSSQEEILEEDSKDLDPYFCYLLKSKNPKWVGRSYVGSTNDKIRRLRQHNGEITKGAKKTRKLRPLEMVCFVSGFATRTEALAFEWAWQHPKKTRLLKKYRAEHGRSVPKGSWILKDALKGLKILSSCWQGIGTLEINWLDVQARRDYSTIVI